MGTLSYCWIILLPFIAISGVVLGHWLMARWIKNRHWVIIVVASILGEIWVLLKTGQSAPKGLTLAWLNGLSYMVLNTVIFGGLCYGYFTVINLNITALRIRLLKIIYQSPDKTVPETVLMAEYHPEAVIQMRIARLEKMHQIHCDTSGQCVLKRKELAYLVRFIQKIRNWLHIKPIV